MQQHQNFSSSFQPIKKRKILPSSPSSGGGGGSIPCGRGPLGSYLDGMESARDTASDGTDDAVTENDEDANDDDHLVPVDALD